MNQSTRLSLVCLAIGSIASIPALAQDKADGQWRGTGGAALSLTSGNTDSSNLQLNADAKRVTSQDKITLQGAVNYARSKEGGVDRTTANRWNTFGQYDYNLTPRTFVFGKLGLEGDELIDLRLRSSIGAGLGYKLINTEETNFEVFGGLGYTTDRYSSVRTIDGRTDTRFSRASVLLGESSSHRLSPTVSFKQRLEVSPGISGDKAVLARFTAGLAVALNGALDLTVGVTDSYNSRPAPGTEKNDVGLFTGVSYRFGAK